MEIKKIHSLDNQTLEEIGLEWHSDPDNTPYIADELVVLKEEEAQKFYEAGNELYDMFVEAAEYVIENDLFFELDIPNAIVPMIKQGFEEDIHWHLYGRFDFAGGLDGQPIKLLEFNADTPTMLYETAVVQWALLKSNGLDENKQFNNIFEMIGENFKRIITLGDDPSRFEELYEGWKILFSSIGGNVEEERTTKFLKEIAQSVGFETHYAPIDLVEFSPHDGVLFEGVNYEFLFKLIPWENIAIDEPELAGIMQKMMENKNTIFLNPAYTLLFQSKRILKILWDLFPNHPLLLETSYEPLKDKKQVLKRAFGREGANIEILDKNQNIIVKNTGIYQNHKAVYQEFCELNKNGEFYYQPNVFFAYESCGLGFRKGGLILDNYSKFVGHYLK
ncbi:glutathionylspermidine synthase family protein [Helicobacter sp. faydin-H20]|uniref:glutathionylspermidine synthase family protein n=1 Tax=Helicobacter anatolicus TaxID=2905874 RepID=UPI001E59C6FF|nr:glutathionylspermidine synthase family protein [Helicobacter anatolicus]MCE3036333.1 glutathionylspermidine synthase family protein [Helicobacter anatolicus]